MLQSLFQSWSEHPYRWLVEAAISVALYIGIALAIPIALAGIPADYFARPRSRPRPLVRLLRALAGVVVAAVGVALLFLPGPGVLAIVLGLSIIGGDLAAGMVRKLVARPRVLEAINKIRVKRGKPPLLPPAPAPHDSA